MSIDSEIAARARLKPIAEIAAKLDIPASALIPYGYTKAKLSGEFLETLAGAKLGKLILVTAISPTPAGEGKTTTTIGLGDALNRLGKRTAICLREPSLGPCFGAKGGATGGGHAQIGPANDINLHFTGDIHAVSTAHNLLAAMIDNHMYWGHTPALDPRRVTWPRVLDMNDRALRQMVIGLGGPAVGGLPRESRFDITTASEVMAILCLANDLQDLQARLGRIVVGQTAKREMVTAGEIKAVGAMAALLRDAFMPNIVQTLEGNPALIHGGPFANIAHGCNSVTATRAGLRLADYVVTEAGFGADLGAEKFIDIKCRQAGLAADIAVIVATIRALKYHGGVEVKELGKSDPKAVERGLPNLLRHVENMGKFGIKAVVAINAFTADTADEVAVVEQACRNHGVRVVHSRHWEKGGEGAAPLAEAVVAELAGRAQRSAPLYPAELPLKDKVETIAREIYRADGVAWDAGLLAQLKGFEAAGFGSLPVCIAKTQFSFSADASLRAAPTGHVLPAREVRLSAGAGFVVVVCGAIQTMPGLGRVPAAYDVGLDSSGAIVGLA
jgi:formate--tetrahydrofolate ligase